MFSSHLFGRPFSLLATTGGEQRWCRLHPSELGRCASGRLLGLHRRMLLASREWRAAKHALTCGNVSGKGLLATLLAT